MPNKTPELARERKQAWYEKHKEEILKRKREQRAAQKKQRVQRPKPAPTPEQIARTRELNRQACYQYRATHLAQVCLINWIYYHRNRDRIVHQQRGVVTAEVVVVVPAPARRRVVRGRVGAVVTGRDRSRSAGGGDGDGACSGGRDGSCVGGQGGLVNSVTMSVMLLRSKGGAAEGEPTPAGDRDGVSMRADKSVCCPPSLCRH